MTLPKKVGLALGGGGAKGLAHIGVIRELERAGVEISCIAGTSMGALVGGFYAATKNIGALENIFLRVRDEDILSTSSMLRGKGKGLFRDARITDVIEDYLKGVKIEDCKIPFKAIATDVKTGAEMVIEKGNLIEAIKASTALPLVFAPVEIDGKLLMDGGFVNPVPADVVRGMPSDYVLAIDVCSKWVDFSEESFGLAKVYSMIPKALSIIEYQIARRILPEADFVLYPPVSGFGWFEFASTREIIAAGESEMRNHLREIVKVTGSSPRSRTPAQKFFDFILYKN